MCMYGRVSLRTALVASGLVADYPLITASTVYLPIQFVDVDVNLNNTEMFRIFSGISTNIKQCRNSMTMSMM